MKPYESVLDGRESPQVEIVVPVRNEERDLAPSVGRLCAYLRAGFPFTARVTIADNGSSDQTWAVAKALCREFVEVSAVHLDQPGRGRALRTIWSSSHADVLAYMDVDLSTDLNALLPLVAPLLSGHSDVAIGSRLARGSRVVRGPRREIISRGYNLLLHASLGTGFSDAQCGFKAIRREQARVLLPLTTDTGWFFDTELLVLAERAGLRIHEVPVDWIDDTDSRVDIMATVLADLRGIARLGRGLTRGTIKVPVLREAALPNPGGTARRPRDLPRQVASFVVIGAGCTLAYIVLFLLFRTVMPAQPANALSLLVTAVANTALNRRHTFGIRGRARAAHHQAKGLIAFAVGLALTSGSLAGLHAMSAHPAVALEVTVLVVANLVATVLRFLLMRTWVFGTNKTQPPSRTTDPARAEALLPTGHSSAGSPTAAPTSAGPMSAARPPVGPASAVGPSAGPSPAGHTPAHDPGGPPGRHHSPPRGPALHAAPRARPSSQHEGAVQ
ncbi:MAG TPA: glycosyltransferase [Streptosporangiaceae bacterium]|jgi:putative flippase GtrA/glycosyltransferase involved in cell wall biosynthesis